MRSTLTSLLRSKLALVVLTAVALLAVAGTTYGYSTLGKDVTLSLDGKVEQVAPNAATVRLITDSTVQVAAWTVGGGTSGVVTPKLGNPRDLILKYTSKNDSVKVGAVVVTKGTTSKRNDIPLVYPPDLPIGKVMRIDNPGLESQEVHLRPFVDLRKVQFVQVLTKRVNDNR